MSLISDIIMQTDLTNTKVIKEIEKLSKDWTNNLDIPDPDPLVWSQSNQDPFGWASSSDSSWWWTPWSSPMSNSSMLTIWDFMIKSLKTYNNRAWWKIVIWKDMQSVEAIPNDILIKDLVADQSKSWSWETIYSVANGNQFNFSVTTWTATNTDQATMKPETLHLNIVDILVDGIYEVEFAYGFDLITNINAIRWIIAVNWAFIINHKYDGTPLLSDVDLMMSWYRKKYLSLKKWDKVEYILKADYSWSWSFTLLKDYTYWSIHYLASNR